MTQVEPTLGPGGDPDDAALAAILEVVRGRTGTDFAGYRAATVRRRVMNRVLSAGAQTLEGYLSRVRADPREVGELVERLTIKVSRFYRNPGFVPALGAALADRAGAAGDRPLRAWSAGCGRGEEAYTLAILLAELGQPWVAGQVVGSDIDAAALRAASAARYPDEALVDLPPPLRARHLQASGPFHVVREGIRARVRLVAHDLTAAQEPPEGGGFDLVACRNTLISFRPEVQARVQRVLLRGLAPGGLLWLGEAEWPSPAAARVLEPVDKQARLFRAVGEEGAA